MAPKHILLTKVNVAIIASGYPVSTKTSVKPLICHYSLRRLIGHMMANQLHWAPSIMGKSAVHFPGMDS